MKKIIFLLAMTTFLFSDFAMQAQTKKELRAKRKAHRECMRMHNRMVREQQNMIAYQDAGKEHARSRVLLCEGGGCPPGRDTSRTQAP